MPSSIRPDVRLEGGAALEEASSSASLPRLRPPDGAPRLAEFMLGCNGELVDVSEVSSVALTILSRALPHVGCVLFGGAVWAGVFLRRPGRQRATLAHARRPAASVSFRVAVACDRASAIALRSSIVYTITVPN